MRQAEEHSLSWELTPLSQKPTRGHAGCSAGSIVSSGQNPNHDREQENRELTCAKK